MATLSSGRTPAENRLAPPGDADLILQQLERILASAAFCNSKRCSGFLRFIVEQAMLGHANQLKERMIGIAVFDRPPDYDAATDAIVRVTAGEVRRRLAQYYVENAHREELRIRLEPGSYIPDFDRQSSPELPSEPAPPLALERDEPAPAPPRKLRRLFIAGGFTLAAIALCAAAFAYWSFRPTPIERFWQPFFQAQGTVLVCLGDLSKSASVKPNSESSGMQSSPSGSDFLDLGDVQAMNHVARILTRHGAEVVSNNSAQATLIDLRHQPDILIGGSTNQWTMRAMPLFRYQLAFGITHGINGIRDRDDHNRIRWTVDFNVPLSRIPMTYAIIARYVDPATNQPTVIIDGIGAAGTIAGADFLTSADYFNDFAVHAPHGWEKRNLEILLQTQLIGGEYGPPHVIATYYW